MSRSRREVLGLFAKWPRPGQVKTRLAAATSAEFAAEVAEAFLRDSLERWGSVRCAHLLAFDPPEGRDYFSTASPRWEIEPQRTGDLGARMQAFFMHCADRGFERAILLGTDSPTVPIEFVNQALTSLDRTDLVLGPATDGGFYLIGGRLPLPDLFSGISWSQPGVLSAVVTRIEAASRSLTLLPPWYDIDTWDDWVMLRGHFAAMRRAGIDPLAPRTEALARREFTSPDPDTRSTAS